MREIAIVGAGLTGLVAALRLAVAGKRVTVFERYPEPGGLVATFDAGGERLECFYHHVFTTDTDYVALAAELGLAGEIAWLPSRMGIWTRGRLWDFGTPASLLRFAPLPWPDKVRFALSTLYLSRRSGLAEFEGTTAHDWLLRCAGHAAYASVWGPLLAQKFAERAESVSMAWLWNKVHMRGRSRGQGGMGERLGYMSGSFGRLVDVLAGRVDAAGVRLEMASPVRAIRPVEGGVEVATRKNAAVFDAVLFTAAPAELLRVAGDHLPDDYRRRLTAVDHTHALCCILELDRRLTDYYWLNIADPAFPFGGVIEQTNFVSPARYGGRHLVYLSKYVLADHPLWQATDAAIWDAMLPWLPRLNLAFDASWIRAKHVFRAAFAQPIIPCDYSRTIPPFATPIPGLYHACMAQVYPEDRGQSYAVRAADRAAAALLEGGLTMVFPWCPQLLEARCGPRTPCAQPARSAGATSVRARGLRIVRLAAATGLLAPAMALAQAALQPQQVAPPTLKEVRKAMGIPSAGEVRGQQDAVGFASTVAQMARTWELSATPPLPEALGPAPAGTVVGVICPHDDYLYASRAYRQVLPLVTAKTVVLVGVFHKYRAFGMHDVLVFDDYRAWRAPDGEIPISPLRDGVLARLPAGTAVQSAAAHDREHSLEALAYWLRHARADVEIVPIIVPSASFERLEELSGRLADALAATMRERGMRLGPDVAIAISSDAVHYGADFAYTPYGGGGVEPYVKACERDRELLTGPLAGVMTHDKAREFFTACVDPGDPTRYRLTWCGRFSIPVGLLLLQDTAAALGLPAPVGFPISYSTSVGQPELPVREVGMGETAPANLYHFVGYPAAVYTIGS